MTSASGQLDGMRGGVSMRSRPSSGPADPPDRLNSFRLILVGHTDILSALAGGVVQDQGVAVGAVAGLADGLAVGPYLGRGEAVDAPINLFALDIMN